MKSQSTKTAWHANFYLNMVASIFQKGILKIINILTHKFNRLCLRHAIERKEVNI